MRKKLVVRKIMIAKNFCEKKNTDKLEKLRFVSKYKNKTYFS